MVQKNKLTFKLNKMNTHNFKNGDIIKEKEYANVRLLTSGLPFTFHESLVDKNGYLSVFGVGEIFVNEHNFELVHKAALKTVNIPIEIIENVFKYCEDKAIFDKLGNYGDFYYKIKTLIK